MHLVIEALLLELSEEQSKSSIRKLKEQGYKTEPAFAKLCAVAGDPYLELRKISEQVYFTNDSLENKIRFIQKVLNAKYY